MKIKVFVLTYMSRDNDNFTKVEVELVASTMTKAKEKFAELKEEIINYYNEEFPDNFEIGDDYPTLWNVSCKDEEIWEELQITEKNVDEYED